MHTFDVKVTIITGLLSLATVVTAQKNVTVPVTDPTIQYSGTGTGPALICKVDSNGFFVGGQAGCYNVPSNCTDSIAAGQSLDSAASFKFKGSAIYITGLLYSLSPIYTVTLDGNSTDVDGVRASGPFICSPLFSASNLDPNVEHTIRLSVKEASPNRNMTIDPNGQFTTFGLANLIYTVPDVALNASQGSNSINPQSSSTSSTATSPSASPSTSAASPRQYTVGLHVILPILGALALGSMVGPL